jgi:hypothetical protein
MGLAIPLPAVLKYHKDRKDRKDRKEREDRDPTTDRDPTSAQPCGALRMCVDLSKGLKGTLQVHEAHNTDRLWEARLLVDFKCIRQRKAHGTDRLWRVTTTFRLLVGWALKGTKNHLLL